MPRERFRFFRPADLLLLPLFLLIVLLGGRGSDPGPGEVVVHGPGCDLRIDAGLDTVMIVEGGMGPLTVELEGGRVRIADSPCPGRDCMNQGWISSPGIPLVCMPSGVFVLLEPREDDDSAVDAVSY